MKKSVKLLIILTAIICIAGIVNAGGMKNQYEAESINYVTMIQMLHFMNVPAMVMESSVINPKMQRTLNNFESNQKDHYYDSSIFSVAIG